MGLIGSQYVSRACVTCLISILEHLEHGHFALRQLPHPHTHLVLERRRQSPYLVQI
jgi:hypothetical protein